MFSFGQYNPLSIITIGLGLFTALHLGAGWIENKYKIGAKSTTIFFLKRDVKKLEKSLLMCYDLKNDESLEDKLRKCLLKSHQKRFFKKRSIRKCKKKYETNKDKR